MMEDDRLIMWLGSDVPVACIRLFFLLKFALD